MPHYVNVSGGNEAKLFVKIQVENLLPLKFNENLQTVYTKRAVEYTYKRRDRASSKIYLQFNCRHVDIFLVYKPNCNQTAINHPILFKQNGS